MPTELPTTVIGLIAFIVLCCGYFLYRMFEASNTRSKENVAQFMGYIENKNGIVLKQAETFRETMTDVQNRFDKSLADQGARHKEMMDDFAARLEATLPINGRNRRL